MVIEAHLLQDAPIPSRSFRNSAVATQHGAAVGKNALCLATLPRAQCLIRRRYRLISFFTPISHNRLNFEL